MRTVELAVFVGVVVIVVTIFLLLRAKVIRMRAAQQSAEKVTSPASFAVSQDKKSGEPADEPEFEEPPGWAQGFNTPDWTRFMREVRSCLTARKIPFVVEETGQIQATLQGVENRFGLMNLAQTCKQVKQEDWPAVVQRHFDSLLKTERERKDVEGKLKDFAQIKSMLVVRLAPDGMLPRELLVCREDLPGTISYLALDLPTSIRSLKPDEVAGWGKTNAELFEVALENVVRLAKPEVSTPELEEGVTCTALVGESFFVATHALMLDLYPDCLGAHGSLVAVPHRHCVLAYPIESLSVIKAIPRLALIGRKLEAEGPGSISPKLYWYHHGAFILLPYEIKENTFNFAPPEDFVAVLNQLGEG